MIQRKSVVLLLIASLVLSNTASAVESPSEGSRPQAKLEKADVIIAMPFEEVDLTDMPSQFPSANILPIQSETPTSANSSSGFKQTCKSWFNFGKSIIDPTELVYPMTAKRALYWTLYAGIGTGAYLLDHYYNASQYIVDEINAKNLYVMGIVYGTEPLVSIINLVFSKYPNAMTPVDEESRIFPTPGAEEVALVIPCHNSENKITKTIKAALRHLKPEQIFLVDNGNSAQPADKTKEVAHSIDPAINYIWLPMGGSKNTPQYVGAIAAKLQNYKYVLTTDDDVTIPETFNFGTDRVKGHVKGVCYPVRAVTESQNPGPWAKLLVGWQNIEYQNADMGKLVEDAAGGVLYPHGAASLWDTDTLIAALKRHDLVFFSEDLKLGLALQELKGAMAMVADCTLDTDAPENFPDYYKQRVRSWEMSRYMYLGKKILNIFKKGPPRPIAGQIYTRSMQALDCVNTIADVARVPIVIVMAGQTNFWLRFAAFSALPIVPNLVRNYFKCDHRPDLQDSAFALITLPVYKLIGTAVTVLALPKALFCSIPGAKHQPTILEMEASKDPRCVWMQWDNVEQNALPEMGSPNEGVPKMFHQNHGAD
jgi:glycosyltransferase involved in cell wall biosynthesis